jgi:hypothetical protein
MARRKNAAALFEVIHADNRIPRRAARWWPQWFGRGSSSASSAMAPETISYETPEPSGPSLLARAFNLIPSMPRIGMSLDPERQVVRLQFSYTGALVSAFTLVVLVALAYLVGRQTSHRPMPALAEQTTEELRNGPAYAEVLDIGGDTDPPVAMAVGPAPTGARPAPAGAAGAAASMTSASAQQTAARTTLAAGQQQAQPGSAAGTAATAARPQQNLRPSHWIEPKAPDAIIVSDKNRAVGLQYVIVQSYPEEEKQLAESAMQTLNQHGVLCTVERGLPYAPSWYCVVGITGFARTKEVAEYDAYVARIQQISDQFAGTSKFKKFEPKPFRWREMKGTTPPPPKPPVTTGAAKTPPKQ